MNVEIMVYAYLMICFSMIVFNGVCVVVFRRRDRQISRKSSSIVITPVRTIYPKTGAK